VRLLIRAFIAALAGGLLGAAILSFAYFRDPGLTFELNGPLPAFVSGFHDGERDGDTSLAWTKGRVDVDLRTLDRRASWSCALTFRAFRPEGQPLPTVVITVDGARVASVAASPEFHDLGFTIPAGPRGTRLAIDVAPTFVPGGADKRTLGIQVDRLQCRPAARAWPPSRAVQQMGAATGYTALMLCLLGFSTIGWLAGAAALAIGASLLVTIGGAIYADHSNTMLLATVIVFTVTSGLLTSVERAAGRRVSSAARAVFAISMIVLIVKLVGLLHPSKPIIDAMFHAHRLDWVLGGRYFFTQPFVGGVEMPYAIGLYLFAAPWASIVADHVALVRVVTTVSDVAAGMLLYPLVSRLTGDKRAGAIAVLFYHLAPLPYAFLGNANLTNIFGQSVALAVVVAAALWNVSLRRPLVLGAFTVLVAWAFCSHVSTLTMLVATLGVMAVLDVWRGDAVRRQAGIAIVVAVAGALAISWLIYYRHFGDEIFGAFSRMFSGGASATPPTAEEAAKGYMSVGGRMWDALSQARGSVGWPIFILAAVGAWSLWRLPARPRVAAALAPWAVMWLVFTASTVFSRVDAEYVRYATEFLGRINLAALPLMAVLAGRGVSAGWLEDTPAGARTAMRVLAVVFIGWALFLATQSLLGWFDR
jgi:hypothetical protein